MNYLEMLDRAALPIELGSPGDPQLIALFDAKYVMEKALARLAEYEVLAEKFLVSYADDIIEANWWREYLATHPGPRTPEEIAAKKQEDDELRRRVNATVICRKLSDARRTAMNAEEPDPVPNTSRPIWELVIEDMQERNEIGIKKYGTPLQANNRRNSLLDAYQEALDLCVYLRQALEEDR